MGSKQSSKQVKFPSWIPAHLSAREKEELLVAECQVVIKAECQVLADWHRLRDDMHAMPPQTFARTTAAAGSAARETFRARVLAKAAKPNIDLRGHITRLLPGKLSPQ